MAAAGAGRLAAAALLFLPVVAVLFLIAPLVAVSIGDADVVFRATLIRTAESRNLSLAAERSRRRLSMYTSGAGTQAPVNKNRGGGDYIMQFSIGEPPLPVSAEADTGSDLVWVKCSPCNGCAPPPSPLYDPAQSSSSGELPCSSRLCQALGVFRQCTDDSALCRYQYVYGLSVSGDHYTQGVLGTETFTFGDGYVANNVSFGCSDTISGSQFGATDGLVGLGRGNLSLVSQLGAGRFTYCLAADPNVDSTILFGSLAALDTSAGDVSSTPLVTNPVPARDTHYYVNLQGISVGGSRLPIEDGTFAINSDGKGGGGVFFDSGTTYAFLADAAYQVVRQAVTSEIQSAGYAVVGGGNYKLDTCFAANPQAVAQMPPLVLHFDGADMSLNGGNYLTAFPNEGLVCMAIMSSSDVSIIGNIMQANFRLLHDLDSMTLSFQATDQC